MVIRNIADMESLLHQIDAERDAANAPRKQCFVIAPIGDAGTAVRDRSDKILRYVIKPAAEECGCDATRADEIAEPGMITSQIIQRILDDPLIIADLTERNPNVFYELALRHAIRKPFIQLIAVGEVIPFDVAGLRTIQIDHTDLESADTARREIIAQIHTIESNPAVIVTPVSIAIDIHTLSQSGAAEDRSIAAIMSALAELKTSVDRISRDTVTSQSRRLDIDVAAELAKFDPKVRSLIEQLPPSERLAFVLASAQGMSIHEVADIMHMRFTEVAKILFRTFAAIRKLQGSDESAEGSAPRKGAG
jgi:hypothetical protein